MASYIKQGQTKVHTANVPAGATILTMSLNWGNTNSKLSLTPYSSGGHQFRTYSDRDDQGGVDGKICIKISSKSGLESGVWRFTVAGVSVSGNEDYTFDVYAQH